MGEKLSVSLLLFFREKFKSEISFLCGEGSGTATNHLEKLGIESRAKGTNESMDD